MNSKPKLGIDRSIFWPSVIILVLVSIPFALLEGTDWDAGAVLNNIFNVIVQNFGWGYMWYALLIFAAGIYFAFSKYGSVVMGDPNEKPKYTLFEYFSLLVAMAIGATVIRTGMMQWVTIYMEPPHGIEPQSIEALMWSQPYSMFLWTVLPFSMFVMTGPAIAYMVNVRKKPTVRISEVCRVIFGDRFTEGFGGKVVDILFLVSIIAGSATFVGFGTPIIVSTVAYMMNSEPTFPLIIVVTIIWIAAFTISCYLGMEKGLKVLSVFNMKLAAVFGLFFIILGPSVFILNHMTDSIGFLIRHYVDFAFYSKSLGVAPDFMYNFTVFWYAYIATWALLHGVYAARVSRGRTVKEMILTYMIAPMFLTILATGILGGLSIERYLTGAVDIPAITAAAGGGGAGMVAAIPHVLATLPLAPVVFVAFIFVAMVFLTTTMDSTTYTIAMYSSADDVGNEDPPKSVRLITGVVIGAIALIMLNIGGLAPLEVMSGLMGIPIIFLQFITVYAAKKMMDQDKAWIHNVRPEKAVAMNAKLLDEKSAKA